MSKMCWQRLIPACLGVCLFAPAMFILFKLPCKHANQDISTTHIESNYENWTINSLPPASPAQVPRQIWALWDQGFENAPRMQKTCLWSHKAANPTFNTRVLDLQSAINLTDVFSLIEKNSWDMMSIQAKSDVIRVLVARILLLLRGAELSSSLIFNPIARMAELNPIQPNCGNS